MNLKKTKETPEMKSFFSKKTKETLKLKIIKKNTRNTKKTD